MNVILWAVLLAAFLCAVILAYGIGWLAGSESACNAMRKIEKETNK